MIVTAIKPQVKRAGWYSIYIDGAYALSVSEAGLLESGLASGDEVSAARLAGLKKASAADKAYALALRYAVLRPRSEWELQEYLRRKGIAPAEAQRIVGRLRDLGMANDRAFARSWVHNRRLLKSTSKRRLQLELQQKHVPADVITEVLAEDQTSDYESIKKLIEKKRKLYKDEQKLLQYLARQGFRYDDIQAALRATE